MFHPRFFRLLVPSAALAACASSAFASTWTVGPAPGPGVDYTNVQAAIDAAAPGDVIQVASGSYAGFTLTKGLSVFGSAGTSTGEITIQFVSGGPRVQLARLTCENLHVLDCSRVVLVDDVIVRDTLPVFSVSAWNEPVARVERCADVRMQRVTISSARKTTQDGYGDALWVVDSRVEVVRSTLTGRDGALGAWQSDTYGGLGTAGVGATGASDVHIALSTLIGGKGGDAPAAPKSAFNTYAGSGGGGAYALSGARLLVTGRPTDVLRGGARGAGPLSGTPGSGFMLGTNTQGRISGVTCTSGEAGWPAIQNGGPVTQLVQPVPADPTLEMLENAHTPGDIVTFAVHAEPGSSVRLRYGRRPIVEDLPLSAEDRLVENVRAYNLGVVPPSGDVFATILLREDAPPGALYVWQAAVAETNGATEMTSSWPAILR